MTVAAEIGRAGPAADERTVERLLLARLGDTESCDAVVDEHADAAWNLACVTALDPVVAFDGVARGLGAFAADGTPPRSTDGVRADALGAVLRTLDEHRVPSFDRGASRVSRVPPTWRAALWLHDAEGLPPRQVGEVMGTSAAAASGAIERARHSLGATARADLHEVIAARPAALPAAARRAWGLALMDRRTPIGRAGAPGRPPRGAMGTGRSTRERLLAFAIAGVALAGVAGAFVERGTTTAPPLRAVSTGAATAPSP